jgi:hypothetical protein
LTFGSAWAVQREDAGQRGDGAQDLRRALGREGYGVLEVEGRGHKWIVDGAAMRRVLP